ncbi:hypothetical protein OLQ22_09085 [Campylobacter jejuni]|nr:hypothetical protein [Campylobacter jejuni]
MPSILILFALLYIRDPFWFFHKPYFREESFMRDMRMQARGIILHKDFDSVIIGTSMLENTSAKEASEKLGDKWVNLSLSGSALNERNIILNYLFKHKQIRKIIYSLDVFTLNNALEQDTKSFSFIYNDNAYKNFKVYFSKKFILCALTFSKKEKCIGKSNLDTLVNWGIENKNEFGNFKNWNKNLLQSKELQDSVLNIQDFNPNYNIDISKNKNYIKQQLLKIINKHPNTRFYLIIPSYSRLNYRLCSFEGYYNKDSELFSKYQAVLKWLVKETSKYPNVKIYGFDDLDYADDIRNYKDPAHYNTNMNSMQLDAIKNQTNILTPENMDEYFKIMEEKIRNYDLTPFVEFIKKQEN